jgi:hypothetical protein
MQLQRYQIDYSKQYGILTDGYEWRFYRATTYAKFTVDEILNKPNEFLSFWNDYIKPEYYYLEIFNSFEQQRLFEEKIDLNIADNRKLFFDDTTKLITNFRIKLKMAHTYKMTEKQEVETVYSYLIQFILFKVIVDNGFRNFSEWYKTLFKIISKYLHDAQNYQSILNNIKMIADYVSTYIYKPFVVEQENINRKIFHHFNTNLNIDDISAWLDIMVYIDKYNFGNLKNEIFGFIYENYLKDLYEDKNKGQYFTDPEVVNLMLEEMGYTPEELVKDKNKISIIDPACGAGTFLYSAVDAILQCFPEQLTENEAKRVEQLISKNVFGLDIEEFPLYLAEMSILMRLLTLIISDNYENPVEEKIKVFKTKDSISEFLDADIGATNPEIDFPTLFSKTDLGYPSFMRDNKNLQEMIESMQGRNGERMRFDFVVGNPPYIGYNQTDEIFKQKIRDNNEKSISMANVYGINLNTVSGRRKPYSPKPNLYAFFVALSLSLLKKGGKMCYIIPQTMLTAGDLDVLRYHLAKNTTIEKLLTFEGNLFVGRGLQQKKPVATSSLIFVVRKDIPEKDHKVEIINYSPYLSRQGETFKVYFQGKHRNKTKFIFQSELLEKINNWNFIKLDKNSLLFHKQYEINSLSIEDYRKKILPEYNEIHLDVGYILDKNNFTKTCENTYPVLDFKGSCGYTRLIFNDFYPTDEHKIRLTRNSRYSTLGRKYNIVNRIKNFQKFYFTTRPVIFNMGVASIIATDNKQVALFLFALLNSPVSFEVLKSNLKITNEKEFQVAIKSIKQYIRIPKITPEKQPIKAEIIALTEKMLHLENVTLKNLVDFDNLMVQRFDKIEIRDSFLILAFNKKDYVCKIGEEKEDFVKKLISEKYFDNGLIFNREFVTLQELKNLEAIDFEVQETLKNQIDNLVYFLYFD